MGQAVEQAVRSAQLQEHDAPFLGVSHSAKGYLWRERLAPHQQANAVAISQRHEIPELLGRVLAARGVTADDTAGFLDPSIKAGRAEAGCIRRHRPL